MPPQDPTQPPRDLPEPQVHNPLAVMQPGEQIIFELKRHPIGLVVIYTVIVVLLTVLAIVSLVLAPTLSTGSADQIRSYGIAAFLIFAILGLLFALIETVVYWGNRWILTDDSITQISQTSLFHKESSSLGLDSLEDVTAEQSGIIPHLFNYGTLKAETAGHRSKFVFPFAPNPNYYAQKILDAHEKENLANRPYRDAYAAAPHDPGPQPPPGQPAPPTYS